MFVEMRRDSMACHYTWGENCLSHACEVLRPNPEGDGALEILAVMAHCGNEVSGDVLVESPCVTPCKGSVSPGALDWQQDLDRCTKEDARD